eukprot:TRINITY_DN221_c0_g3_i2.p1 TRINITY_DN221_c0_g3~~TRINITY_DN221_c0_g3_i2.p1  ORF type:complete len:1219 (-),score=212.32 TRINITY_DN221_c0_g3_i2:55-3711(-)
MGILWREITQFYCFQGFQTFATNGFEEDEMKSIFKKYIENGQAFEIIDGDNIAIAEEFLKTALPVRDTKIYVISILGPQSSGKSTLLNYLFGCQFATSSGRCTKGIYGTLFDLQVGDFDGVLILDTEGLFSSEKTDPEYDRKIVLFCMAASHLVLINVKGEITRNMPEVMGVCLTVLNQLRLNKVPSPSIFFILNQNSDPNVRNHLTAFNKILESFSIEGTSLEELLRVDEANLIVIPNAYNDKTIYSNGSTSSIWVTLNPSDSFGYECSKLFSKIIEEGFRRREIPEHIAVFSDMASWIKLAVEIWITIDQFRDLVHLNEVREYKQKQIVLASFQEFVKNELEGEDKFSIHLKNIEDAVNSNNSKERAVEYFETYWNQEVYTPTLEKWKKEMSKARLTEMIFKFASAKLTYSLRSRQSQLISIINSRYDQKQLREDILYGNKIMKTRIRDLWNENREIDETEGLKLFHKINEEILKMIRPSSQTLEDVRFDTKKRIFPLYQASFDQIRNLQFFQNVTVEFRLSEETLHFKGTRPNQFHEDILEEKLLIPGLASALSAEVLRVSANSSEGKKLKEIAEKVNWEKFIKDLKGAPDYKQIFSTLDNELMTFGYGLSNMADYEIFEGLRKQADLVPKAYWITKSIEKRVLQKDQDFIYYKDSLFSFKSNLIKFDHDFNVPSEGIRHENSRYISSWMLRSWELPNHEGLKTIIYEYLKQFSCNDTIKSRLESKVKEVLHQSDVLQQEQLNVIISFTNDIRTKLDDELGRLAIHLSATGISKLHEIAFLEITNELSSRLYERQGEYYQLWRNEEGINREYFLDQICLSRGQKQEISVAEKIASKIEQSLMTICSKKAEDTFITICNVETKKFNTTRLRDTLDDVLSSQNHADVLEFTTEPEKVFEKEFDKIWTAFCDNNTRKIMEPFSKARLEISELVAFFDELAQNISSMFENDLFSVSESQMVSSVNMKMSRVQGSYQQKRSIAGFRWLKHRFEGKNNEVIQVDDVSFVVNPKLKAIPFPPLNQNDWQTGIKKVILDEDDTKIPRISNFLRCLSERLKKAAQGFEEKSSALTNLAIVGREKGRYKKAAVGCLEKCPKCHRICDVDHTDKPGSPEDLHACHRGHQHFGFAGIRYHRSKRVCLEHCSSQKDDSRWYRRGEKTTWGKMKKEHPMNKWNYSGIPADMAIKQGRFKQAWKFVGRAICQKHNLDYHEDFEQDLQQQN